MLLPDWSSVVVFVWTVVVVEHAIATSRRAIRAVPVAAARRGTCRQWPVYSIPGVGCNCH